MKKFVCLLMTMTLVTCLLAGCGSEKKEKMCIRDRVYTGLYTFEGDKFCVLCEEKAVGIADIVQEINAMGKPVVFLGDGVPVHRTYIEENIQVECHFAPPHLNAQRAGALAALGKIYFEEGRLETADAHVPEYLRLSQACLLYTSILG